VVKPKPVAWETKEDIDDENELISDLLSPNSATMPDELGSAASGMSPGLQSAGVEPGEATSASPTPQSAALAAAVLPAISSLTELHRTPSLANAHGTPSLTQLSERLKSQILEQTREKDAEIDKKILSTTDVAERVRQEGAREGVGLGIEDKMDNSFKNLEEIYDPRDLPLEKERYAKIRAKFVETYGSEPEFYARSPGRVNLIGDNIDVNDYSVLPLALDRDMVVSF
jgi:hypothetical protein